MADSGSGHAAGTLRPEEQTAWDQFVGGRAGASLYHLSGWQELIAQVFGHETHYLYATAAGGEWRGVLPLVRLRSHLFGDFLVSLPYFNYGGPLGANAETELGLMERAAALAARLGSTHIEFRCSEERASAWPARTDKVNMLLDLAATEDEQFKRFDSKLRAQIRRPTKEGAVADVGGVELLDDFYAVFARNMRDLGTPVYGRTFFAAMMRKFPQACAVVRVRLQGRAVAAAFLLGYRDRLEIPWASSLREFNRSGANMLLYWESLRYAVARGYRRFDFGRSTRDSGTYRFKTQWGALPEQQHWYYWLAPGRELPNLTPHNPRYGLAVRVWRRLPLPIANLFGPLIVKNLP